MCDHYNNNEHILCSQCDMLVMLPTLKYKYKALCPRCGTVLITQRDLPRNCLIACVIIALFMLVLSDLFLFIRMRVSGINSQIKLLEISAIMFSNNYISLGIFFLLFVQIIPAFCLLAILIVVNQSKISQKIKIRLACILFKIKKWGMAEIFLVGILVSFVKLIAYGEVGIGNSFISWCLYCILLLHIFQNIDRRWIWNDIAPTPVINQQIIIGIPGIQQGLRSCVCCTAILPAKQKICPRCGTKGYIRNKNSLQRTIALLVTAIILYILANILPIMVTDLLGKKVPSTILTGIIVLWNQRSYPLAGLIFLVSIIMPTLKMSAIAWLCFNATRYGKQNSKLMHLIYEIVELVGRWSMIDIFVIAVLSALVRIQGIMSIYPARGSLMFALVAVLTMCATITFDPRLSWDQELKIKGKGNK